MANPPEALDPAFAAQFLKIQKVFVGGLAQRLLEIQHAADAHACHVALHRLAGAAGGYGFGELSRLAREAMDAMEGGAGPTLQAALTKLADAIAQIQSAA